MNLFDRFDLQQGFWEGHDFESRRKSWRTNSALAAEVRSYIEDRLSSACAFSSVSFLLAILRSIPQRLKPPGIRAFAARLKPCPSR